MVSWYTVDGIEYKLQEIVMYEIMGETVKLGKFPVGRTRKAMLGSIAKGTQVRVRYQPEHPKKAYLPDNDNGHHFNLG